jgi:hypothetical protein
MDEVVHGLVFLFHVLVLLGANFGPETNFLTSFSVFSSVCPGMV